MEHAQEGGKVAVWATRSKIKVKLEQREKNFRVPSSLLAPRK